MDRAKAAYLPLGLAAVLALTSCERERRELASRPETAPHPAATDLAPGGPAAAATDPRGGAYEGNAFHIAQGQRYFKWFNCSGCHANGGGGMGPALIDDKWRYGASIDQVYDSIAQGRPNGMPAFGSKIPPTQIWELAAYVRSLSGQADKLAAPSRADAMRSIPPINNMNRLTPAGPDGGAR